MLNQKPLSTKKAFNRLYCQYVIKLLIIKRYKRVDLLFINAYVLFKYTLYNT